MKGKRLPLCPVSMIAPAEKEVGEKAAYFTRNSQHPWDRDLCHSLWKTNPTAPKPAVLPILPQPPHWRGRTGCLLTATDTPHRAGRNIAHCMCNKGKLSLVSLLQSTHHLEKPLEKVHYPLNINLNFHYPSSINKQRLWLAEEACTVGYDKLCGPYSHGWVQL